MIRSAVTRSAALGIVTIAMLAASAGCGKKKPVVAAPAPVPFPGASAPATEPAVPPAPPEPPAITSGNVSSSPLRPWDDKGLDEINGPNSPLKPVFFQYDSDELDDTARKTLDADAAVLKTYSSWVVTVEGHCDERGTAEYNLALGERRALSAKNYLVTLGIAADRIKTVSYGKEFPFDPGHDETAYAKNRRAHIMLTAK